MEKPIGRDFKYVEAASATHRRAHGTVSDVAVALRERPDPALWTHHDGRELGAADVSPLGKFGWSKRPGAPGRRKLPLPGVGA